MSDKVKVTIAALANCDFTVSDCITINENEQVISQSKELRIIILKLAFGD